MSMHQDGDNARSDHDFPLMGVGRYLQQLRKARRFSLQRLASASAVSARSLSYWESGVHRPRIPELEAVLSALSATIEEHAHALLLLGAPRAVPRLQTLSPTPQVPIPSGGDLLRAMRHRRRLNLRDIADRIGVSVSTLSRWESGQVIPGSEQLPRLFAVLDAHPYERIAIQQPVWRGGTDLFGIPSLTASMETVQESFVEFGKAFWENMEDKLHDLRFLTFESIAWRLSQQGKTEAERQEGIRLLADVHAHYASYLEALSRYGEAAFYANRALDSAGNDSGSIRQVLRAAFAAAKSEVYRGPKPRPEYGIHILERWEPWVRQMGNKPYEAWLLSSKAEYLSLAGQKDAALAAGLRACQVAEDADANEHRLRERDLARIQMRADQVDTALSLVTFSPDDTPYWRTQVNLIWSEGLLRLGDYGAAQSYLQQAEEDSRAYDLSSLSSQISTLRARFT